MHWFILLSLLGSQPPITQPSVQPLQPQVTVHAIQRDVRNMPDDHFFLIEQARKLDAENSDDYLSRLDRYLDEATDCSHSEKTGWLLELAYRTHAVEIVRNRVLPRLNRIILEQPACFLSGVGQTTLFPDARQVFGRFIIDPATLDAAQAKAAIRPLLAHAEFAQLAEVYEQQEKWQEKQLAREAEQRRLKVAAEQRKHRQPLKDSDFMNAQPQAYWALWDEVSREARACTDTEAVADLLDSALMHADNGHRKYSAEFIEHLSLDNPACMLDSFEDMRNEYAFVNRYLKEPLLFSSIELLSSLAYADVTGEDALRHRKQILALLEKQRRARLDNTFNEARFLWNVSIAYTDNAGRIYVTPRNRTSATITDAQMDALWEQATPAGIHSDWDHEVRLLPLDALDFLTNGRYPSYQLLQVLPDGVMTAQARPSGAAIMEWYCEGKLLVLQLAPEPHTEDDSTHWRFPGVLEFGDARPLPEVSDHRHNSEDWFNYGRIAWPSQGRSFDYQHSDSFTETILRLKDNQTGEKRYAGETGWSCH